MTVYMGEALQNLQAYKPKLTHKPVDFKAFWQARKDEIQAIEAGVTVNKRPYSVPSVEVYDLLMESWDGTPIQGMFIKPKGKEKCPVIVSYHGYTGNYGLPMDYLKWTSLGVAVYAFDVRGQGTTPDHAHYSNGARIPGWMLLGIHDPVHYYYTNVLKDALLQLKWINLQELVEIERFGLVGSSQGGGLALSIGALTESVDFICADYPFSTHYEQALKDATSGPYMEILTYFRLHDPQYQTYPDVLQTLSYIDSMHFCPNITCPVLMSIGLKDDVTPPTTVFAAYNHLASNQKEIEIYPEYMHEVNPFHEEKKLQFVSQQLSR